MEHANLLYDSTKTIVDSLDRSPAGLRQAVAVIRAAEAEADHYERHEPYDTDDIVRKFMSDFETLSRFLQRPSYDGGVYFGTLVGPQIDNAWNTCIHALLAGLRDRIPTPPP